VCMLTSHFSPRRLTVTLYSSHDISAFSISYPADFRQSDLLLSLIKFNALRKSDGVMPEFFLVLRKISPLPKKLM
ncbi:hypothetical protein, partial [Parasutterella excrementihominis]